MQKQYSQAPLPFMGQKRMFAGEFRHFLKHISDDTVFVDLFGGSGLLSHIAKCEKPGSTVVYNDYDNYRKRLSNIPRTNALLSDIRQIVNGHPRKKILSEEHKQQILRRVLRDEESGYVDYITLSASLLFSMHYVLTYQSLCEETFYNNVRMSDYAADNYLDGLKIESCDYKKLYEKYRDIPNVVFLIDPPYLSTEVGTYRMNWGLSDYLDVLLILQNTSFIYFTSNKSSILELCEWIGENDSLGNPFAGAQKRVFNAHVNYSSSYTDIMLYKKKKGLDKAV